MASQYGSQSMGLGVGRSPDGSLIISEKEYGTNRYRQDLQARDFQGINTRVGGNVGGGSLRPQAASGALQTLFVPSKSNHTGRPYVLAPPAQNNSLAEIKSNKDTDDFYAASYSKAPSVQANSIKPPTPSGLDASRDQPSGERWKKIESLQAFSVVKTPSTAEKQAKQMSQQQQQHKQANNELNIHSEFQVSPYQNIESSNPQPQQAQVLNAMRQEYNREKPILLQPPTGSASASQVSSKQASKRVTPRKAEISGGDSAAQVNRSRAPRRFAGKPPGQAQVVTPTKIGSESYQITRPGGQQSSSSPIRETSQSPNDRSPSDQQHIASDLTESLNIVGSKIKMKSVRMAGLPPKVQSSISPLTNSRQTLPSLQEKNAISQQPLKAQISQQTVLPDRNQQEFSSEPTLMDEQVQKRQNEIALAPLLKSADEIAVEERQRIELASYISQQSNSQTLIAEQQMELHVKSEIQSTAINLEKSKQQSKREIIQVPESVQNALQPPKQLKSQINREKLYEQPPKQKLSDLGPLNLTVENSQTLAGSQTLGGQRQSQVSRNDSTKDIPLQESNKRSSIFSSEQQQLSLAGAAGAAPFELTQDTFGIQDQQNSIERVKDQDIQHIQKQLKQEQAFQKNQSKLQDSQVQQISRAQDSRLQVADKSITSDDQIRQIQNSLDQVDQILDQQSQLVQLPDYTSLLQNQLKAYASPLPQTSSPNINASSKPAPSNDFTSVKTAQQPLQNIGGGYVPSAASPQRQRRVPQSLDNNNPPSIMPKQQETQNRQPLQQHHQSSLQQQTRSISVLPNQQNSLGEISIQDQNISNLNNRLKDTRKSLPNMPTSASVNHNVGGNVGRNFQNVTGVSKFQRENKQSQLPEPNMQTKTTASGSTIDVNSNLVVALPKETYDKRQNSVSQSQIIPQANPDLSRPQQQAAPTRFQQNNVQQSQVNQNQRYQASNAKSFLRRGQGTQASQIRAKQPSNQASNSGHSLEPAQNKTSALPMKRDENPQQVSLEYPAPIRSNSPLVQSQQQQKYVNSTQTPQAQNQSVPMAQNQRMPQSHPQGAVSSQSQVFRGAPLTQNSRTEQPEYQTQLPHQSQQPQRQSQPEYQNKLPHQLQQPQRQSQPEYKTQLPQQSQQPQRQSQPEFKTQLVNQSQQPQRLAQPEYQNKLPHQPQQPQHQYQPQRESQRQPQLQPQRHPQITSQSQVFSTLDPTVINNSVMPPAYTQTQSTPQNLHQRKNREQLVHAQAALQKSMETISGELSAHRSRVSSRQKQQHYQPQPDSNERRSQSVLVDSSIMQQLQTDLRSAQKDLMDARQQMERKQMQLERQQDIRDKEMRQQLQAAVEKIPKPLPQIQIQQQPVIQTPILQRSVVQSSVVQIRKPEQCKMSTQTDESSFKIPLTWENPNAAQMMGRLDTLMRKLESKEEEIEHLRSLLSDKTESARGHVQSTQHVEAVLAKIKKENKDLVKQVDLLQMEKQQMLKVEKEILQQDDRGEEINKLSRELQMKNIELKVYANKLKIMREENATVRMQLLDPAMIKRLGGTRHFLDEQASHQQSYVAQSKENLIIDFSRVELTHDIVLLQEEIKQMHVENAVLKDQIASYYGTQEEKQKAQTEYINSLQDQLHKRKEKEIHDLEPEHQMQKLIERLTYQKDELTESKQKDSRFFRSQIQRMQAELKKQEALITLKNQEIERMDRKLRLLANEQGMYKSIARGQQRQSSPSPPRRQLNQNQSQQSQQKQQQRLSPQKTVRSSTKNFRSPTTKSSPARSKSPGASSRKPSSNKQDILDIIKARAKTLRANH